MTSEVIFEPTVEFFDARFSRLIICAAKTGELELIRWLLNFNESYFFEKFGHLCVLEMGDMRVVELIEATESFKNLIEKKLNAYYKAMAGSSHQAVIDYLLTKKPAFKDEVLLSGHVSTIKPFVGDCDEDTFFSLVSRNPRLKVLAWLHEKNDELFHQKQKIGDLLECEHCCPNAYKKLFSHPVTVQEVFVSRQLLRYKVNSEQALNLNQVETFIKEEVKDLEHLLGVCRKLLRKGDVDFKGLQREHGAMDLFGFFDECFYVPSIQYGRTKAVRDLLKVAKARAAELYDAAADSDKTKIKPVRDKIFGIQRGRLPSFFGPAKTLKRALEKELKPTHPKAPRQGAS